MSDPTGDEYVAHTARLTSEVISRFTVTSILLVVDDRKLLLVSKSGQNALISFLEDERRRLGIDLKFEIYPDTRSLPLSGELPIDAIILYGKGIGRLGRKILSPKIILEFDTSGLKTKDKIRLYQKLYGYSKKRPDKPRITSNMSHADVYTYDGFLNHIMGEKLGKSSIIFDAIHKKSAEQFFGTMNVKFKEIEVYSR